MEQISVSFRRVGKIDAEGILGKEHIQQGGFSRLPCATNIRWTNGLCSFFRIGPLYQRSNMVPTFYCKSVLSKLDEKFIHGY